MMAVNLVMYSRVVDIVRQDGGKLVPLWALVSRDLFDGNLCLWDLVGVDHLNPHCAAIATQLVILEPDLHIQSNHNITMQSISSVG